MAAASLWRYLAFPTAALSGRVGVLSKESYFLYARGTGAPAQGIFTGGNEQVLSGTQALQANTWTHLAATYDGAIQRLYVNGSRSRPGIRRGASP